MNGQTIVVEVINELSQPKLVHINGPQIYLNNKLRCAFHRNPIEIHRQLDDQIHLANFFNQEIIHS